jgi:sporulation protein YlmC with PRC-barrel domain
MSPSSHTDPPQDRAISVHKVLGMWIYTPALERLGFVQDLTIDQETGRVSSVMLRIGGRLHMHHRSYPLPWGSLDYSTELEGFIVDLQREELRSIFLRPPIHQARPEVIERFLRTNP